MERDVLAGSAVAAVLDPVEEGVGDHGDESFFGNAFGVDPEVVISFAGFFAAEADLEDVWVIVGGEVAVGEFEDDAGLLAEKTDGGLGIIGVVVSEHLAEFGVGLELFEAVFGDGEPSGAGFLLVEFAEVFGKGEGNARLAHDAGRFDRDAIFPMGFRELARIQAALDEPCGEGFVYFRRRIHEGDGSEKWGRVFA